jgi:hypothetical protein
VAAGPAGPAGGQQLGGGLVGQGADPLGRVAAWPRPAAAEQTGHGAGGCRLDLARGGMQEGDLGVDGQQRPGGVDAALPGALDKPQEHAHGGGHAPPGRLEQALTVAQLSQHQHRARNPMVGARRRSSSSAASAGRMPVTTVSSAAGTATTASGRPRGRTTANTSVAASSSNARISAGPLGAA